MQKDLFDKIISFLQGASWAVVFFGALITFKLFSSFGWIVSIFVTFLYIFISLFLVLLLDFFALNRKRFLEQQKQTKLLEKLVNNK